MNTKSATNLSFTEKCVELFLGGLPDDAIHILQHGTRKKRFFFFNHRPSFRPLGLFYWSTRGFWWPLPSGAVRETPHFPDLLSIEWSPELLDTLHAHLGTVRWHPAEPRMRQFRADMRGATGLTTSVNTYAAPTSSFLYFTRRYNPMGSVCLVSLVGIQQCPMGYGYGLPLMTEPLTQQILTELPLSELDELDGDEFVTPGPWRRKR